MPEFSDEPVETGLSVLSAPDLPSLPAPVTATVNLPSLDSFDLAKLAREVVMNLRPLPEILEPFKLTVEQFDQLKENADFKRIFDSMLIEWHSATNTEKRIKVGAAVLLEEALPSLGARMISAKEDLKDAVETGKLFAKIAGVGEGERSAGIGEKLVINIDLGDDKSLRLEKEITVAPAGEALSSDGEGARDARPIQPFTEAQAGSVEIRAVPEGESGTVEIRSLPKGSEPTP